MGQEWGCLEMVLGNFQCQNVLQIWIIVGQGPTVLAIGADGGCLDILFLANHISFLSSSLWEMHGLFKD